MNTVSCDIGVLGGGIAGLCVARELAASGTSVALIERAAFGEAASYAAAGMLAPLVEARLEEHHVVQFGYECLRGYPQFVYGLQEETGDDVDYRTEGTLIVSADRDDAELLRHHFREQHTLGLPVEWFGGYECRTKEPMLAPRIVGGIHSPQDHQIDNRLLLSALVKSCRLRGVNMIADAGEGILHVEGDDGVVYAVRDAEVRMRDVVIATGAHTDILEDVLPELARAIRPVKGQIMRLDQSAMPLLQMVVRSPEMYLAPKRSGLVVLGASSEDKGFDGEITAGESYELLRAAWECVPGVYEMPIREMRVGFRPATYDHKPLLGRTRINNVWVAMGYYRHGILFAPTAARLLADDMINGTSSGWLDVFAPGRVNEF